MLSYIYRLINSFENEHDFSPNLLQINPVHLEHLKSAFDSNYSIERIMSVLRMDLVINTDCIHPQVSWSHIARTQAS